MRRKHGKQISAVIMSLALTLTMGMTGFAGEGQESGTSGGQTAENIRERAAELLQEQSADGTQQGAADNGGQGQPEGGNTQGQAIPKIRLAVGNGQSTPQYKAEQEVELALRITNEGSRDAQNVRIAPVIENAADWPFEIGNMNYELNVGSIKAGESGTANWKLKVRSDVESKAYKTAFAISYDDEVNEYHVTKNIYVKTQAKPQEKPQENNQPPKQENPQGTGTQETPMPEAGGVYNSEPVVTGGGSGDSGNQSVPRVIVTGFSTEPGVVSAGSNFKLIVHVKNTSTTTAVSNMLFDLQAPASGTDAAAEAPAFLPASGSSSVFLDRIPAGETRDIALSLNARADLVQKPYSIAMSMKYEDGNATQYEGSSSLAVPVTQAARFEFSELEISPESIAVGEEANLTCSIYNTGRVKLYNVKAKFTGDGISGKDVFVGNLEPGATGTIDGMLTGESPVKKGAKMNMTVTYEDEAGKTASVEKTFELEVTKAAETADMGADAAVQAEAKSFPVVPVAAAVAVLAGIIGVTVFFIRKKKKSKLLEEEDLADEVDRFTEDE